MMTSRGRTDLFAGGVRMVAEEAIDLTVESILRLWTVP
jgi:hypothetical protein